MPALATAIVRCATAAAAKSGIEIDSLADRNRSTANEILNRNFQFVPATQAQRNAALIDEPITVDLGALDDAAFAPGWLRAAPTEGRVLAVAGGPDPFELVALVHQLVYQLVDRSA